MATCCQMPVVYLTMGRLDEDRSLGGDQRSPLPVVWEQERASPTHPCRCIFWMRNSWTGWRERRGGCDAVVSAYQLLHGATVVVRNAGQGTKTLADVPVPSQRRLLL